MEGVGVIAIVHLMYEVKIASWLVADNVFWYYLEDVLKILI